MLVQSIMSFTIYSEGKKNFVFGDEIIVTGVNG